MADTDKSTLSHITHEYKKLFSSIATVLVLLAACIALGAAVVFPLWSFATSHSQLYTIVSLIIIAALIIWKIILSVKKSGPRKALSVFLRLALIAASLALIFRFVINANRLAALIVFVSSLIVYGFIHVLFQSKKAQ